MIEFRTFIHREDLQGEPETLFVFGDNMMRKGLGGQAAAMRGEPNAVGIPTKELPSMANNAFLSEADPCETYCSGQKSVSDRQPETRVAVSDTRDRQSPSASQRVHGGL